MNADITTELLFLRGFTHDGSRSISPYYELIIHDEPIDTNNPELHSNWTRIGIARNNGYESGWWHVRLCEYQAASLRGKHSVTLLQAIRGINSIDVLIKLLTETGYPS
jgi:hypothetical protein